jgi:hypothetical protein
MLVFPLYLYFYALNNQRMRNIIFALLFFMPSLASAQLKKNDVDPYTKKEIKETKKVILQSRMSKTLSASVGSVNGNTYIDCYISTNDIFSIKEGDRLIFLFDNDSTLTLYANSTDVASSTYISTLNMTVWKTEMRYKISQEEMEMISRNDIKGVRVYMFKEYLNFNDIKQSKSTKFKNLLDLVHS